MGVGTSGARVETWGWWVVLTLRISCFAADQLISEASDGQGVCAGSVRGGDEGLEAGET